MRALRRRLRRSPAIVLGTSGLLLLGSCASLGGNVRGSFSCDAPDGVCAPSGAIDDRALAAIAGGGEEGDFVPAAGQPGLGESAAVRVARAQPVRPAPGDPARTRERVLRIVFQPYIDERGRLHEATAVHAVVASGDWQQAFAPPRASARAPGGVMGFVSLADAVDQADPPQGADVPRTAGLPSSDAVAAARARKDDPLGAIKADVSDRLAPAATRAPAAAARANPDPLARAAMDSVARGAGEATARPGGQGTGPAPVIRAPGFPANVAKDD